MFQRRSRGTARALPGDHQGVPAEHRHQIGHPVPDGVRRPGEAARRAALIRPDPEIPVRRCSRPAPDRLPTGSRRPDRAATTPSTGSDTDWKGSGRLRTGSPGHPDAGLGAGQYPRPGKREVLGTPADAYLGPGQCRHRSGQRGHRDLLARAAVARPYPGAALGDEGLKPLGGGRRPGISRDRTRSRPASGPGRCWFRADPGAHAAPC